MVSATSSKSALWLPIPASDPPGRSASGSSGRRASVDQCREELDPGAIGRSRREVVAATGEHDCAALLRLGQQPAGQRRLADTGFAANQHDCAVSVGDVRELLLEQRLFRSRPMMSGFSVTTGATRPASMPSRCHQRLIDRHEFRVSGWRSPNVCNSTRSTGAGSGPVASMKLIET